MQLEEKQEEFINQKVNKIGLGLQVLSTNPITTYCGQVGHFSLELGLFIFILQCFQLATNYTTSHNPLQCYNILMLCTTFYTFLLQNSCSFLPSCFSYYFLSSNAFSTLLTPSTLCSMSYFPKVPQTLHVLVTSLQQIVDFPLTP